MNGILVDTCVLLDLFTADPVWGQWSETQLSKLLQSNSLFINSIIYTEISIGFEQIETLDMALAEMNIRVLEMPREALFLTGKVYLRYRRNKGTARLPLPDFFIGAHAAVTGFSLLTRDPRRFQTYYPKLNLIQPPFN
ncbi:MAG: type II toxin-antitoxin system VapC family toxin [Candidatus Sericytochromatia bacterium]|nr:type II toxin-antitoxin system VapC family toxin [Candidatus Sericytochromatia bacterium]